MNEPFFIHLEYQIGAMFEKLKLDSTKGFWCDGMIPLEIKEDASKESILLRATVFIGKTGQERYLLKANIYPSALSKLEDLKEIKTINFINIDTSKKVLEISIDV